MTSDAEVNTEANGPSGPLWDRLVNGTQDGGAEYAETNLALRQLLRTYAAAHPDEETTVALGLSLRRWSEALARFAVDERRQIFGRRPDLPGRGRVVVPWYEVEEQGQDSIRARVHFSRPWLGGNGAVHGGLMPVVFDEVLARLANVDRPPSRTAFLNVNYRAITPAEVDLRLEANLIREEGRKRLVHGRLLRGDTLCAEADALYVALRADQS